MERSALPTIAESLWWVKPGQLAGVRKPQLSDLANLSASGIDALVSLLDDEENLALYQQHQIPHIWLPIKGGTAPTQEQVHQLKHFIESQQRLGHGVAIHCTSGRRRTGTMLAAYLITTGYSQQQALETIVSANSEIELREAQLAFLALLATNLN